MRGRCEEGNHQTNARNASLLALLGAVLLIAAGCAGNDSPGDDAGGDTSVLRRDPV